MTPRTSGSSAIRPDLAVGVYLGYDKPRSMGDSAQAALYAAPIFRDFMKMALANKPDTPFRVPPGIKLISVDAGIRHALNRRRLDHGSLQARHLAVRFLWRRRARPRPMDPARISRSAPARAVFTEYGFGAGGLYGPPRLRAAPSRFTGGPSPLICAPPNLKSGITHARGSCFARRADQAVSRAAEEASLTSNPRRAASRN